MLKDLIKVPAAEDLNGFSSADWISSTDRVFLSWIKPRHDKGVYSHYEIYVKSIDFPYGG
jgi:hypothetical protein